MAIVRCTECASLGGLKTLFPNRHRSRQGSFIPCGAYNCARPAWFWLSQEEQMKYDKGQHLFAAVKQPLGIEVA